MAKRLRTSAWARSFGRSLTAMTGSALRQGTRALVGAQKKAQKQAQKAVLARRAAPPGAGDWIAGLALGPGGARRFRLYRPPGVPFGERLPLLVMLHGCGQDANAFANSTRMNRVAARERFLVLYLEQDRLSNLQGCWNWYDTDTGRAGAEAALIMSAIDQVCLLHAADRTRVAVAGLSAGASMAALLVTRYPERFKAVVMHSGIAPGTAHSTLSALGAMRGRRGTQLPAAKGAAWPPLMVIHGGRDTVVSAHNGQAAAQAWASAADAKAGLPRTVQRGQRHAMTVTDFKHRGRAVATLVEVAALGHAWSGGAAKHAYSDSQGPDASRLVWQFAARQFRA